MADRNLLLALIPALLVTGYYSGNKIVSAPPESESFVASAQPSKEKPNVLVGTEIDRRRDNVALPSDLQATDSLIRSLQITNHYGTVAAHKTKGLGDPILGVILSISPSQGQKDNVMANGAKALAGR